MYVCWSVDGVNFACKKMDAVRWWCAVFCGQCGGWSWRKRGDVGDRGERQQGQSSQERLVAQSSAILTILSNPQQCTTQFSTQSTKNFLTIMTILTTHKHLKSTNPETTERLGSKGPLFKRYSDRILWHNLSEYSNWFHSKAFFYFKLHFYSCLQPFICWIDIAMFWKVCNISLCRLVS